MLVLDCPFCKTEFWTEPWEDGECPKCKEEYSWEELCNEDYSDCWPSLFWKKHIKGIES